MEPANVVQRTMQRVASTRPIAFIFRHTSHLLADPHAAMERDGTTTAVIARAVPDGAEYDAVMCAADAIYSGYPIYRRRITARRAGAVLEQLGGAVVPPHSTTQS